MPVRASDVRGHSRFNYSNALRCRVDRAIDYHSGMSPRRLYCDNAATSFPKPPEVAAAVMRYAQTLGASAGRGAYAEAVETGREIARCRELLSELFHGEDANHFVFTLNCSDALNLAIKGLIDPARGPAHVVCTATDHNSILRPIHAMAEHGWVSMALVPVDPATGLIDPADVRRAVRPETKLIAMTHASNVTGAVQPLRAIGRIARECAVPFVVDAAQSAGHVPIDVQADCVDLLAAPGHKALMGPLGTGFLYVRPGLEKHLRPLREGGTGSQSELPIHPLSMPDKFECGSHNAPGLFGLAAGVEWVIGQTVDALHARQCDLAAAFIDGVSSIEGLTYYGPRGVADRIGVFSVRVAGMAPADLAAALERDFGILTRPGLHCAPHIHAALGTATSGTTRLSFGAFTSLQDVRFATDALAQVAASTPSGINVSNAADVR